jgi:predicted nucleic acid-binding protein
MQIKNIDEAAAILRIIAWIQQYGGTILGSIALTMEIGKTKNAVKRGRIMAMYRNAVTMPATYRKDIFQTLSKLARQAGVKGYDVFHLCYAESSEADYLLTVDEDFKNAASRLNVNVKVINPLEFPLL